MAGTLFEGLRLRLAGLCATAWRRFKIGAGSISAPLKLAGIPQRYFIWVVIFRRNFLSREIGANQYGVLIGGRPNKKLMVVKK